MSLMHWCYVMMLFSEWNSSLTWLRIKGGCFSLFFPSPWWAIVILMNNTWWNKPAGIWNKSPTCPNRPHIFSVFLNNSGMVGSSGTWRLLVFLTSFTNPRRQILVKEGTAWTPLWQCIQNTSTATGALRKWMISFGEFVAHKRNRQSQKLTEKRE